MRRLLYQDESRLEYGRRFWCDPVKRERLLRHWLDERHPYSGRFRERWLPLAGAATLLGLLLLAPAGSAELVLAVPVLDQRLVSELSPLVDELIAVAIVSGLRAVGDYYDDFSQVSDSMVEQLLQAKKSTAKGGARAIG